MGELHRSSGATSGPRTHRNVEDGVAPVRAQSDRCSAGARRASRLSRTIRRWSSSEKLESWTLTKGSAFPDQNTSRGDPSAGPLRSSGALHRGPHPPAAHGVRLPRKPILGRSERSLLVTKACVSRGRCWRPDDHGGNRHRQGSLRSTQPASDTDAGRAPTCTRCRRATAGIPEVSPGIDLRYMSW